MTKATDNDELPDIDAGSNSENDQMRNMTFISTNSRSLQPKIQSLCDYFNELELSFAALTETWLRDSQATNNLITDLKQRNGLEAIMRHRNLPKTSNSGGGVALIYDPNKITFKSIQLKKSNHEVVAALGKIPGSRRKIAVYVVYVPPRTRVAGFKALTKIITDSVHKMKAECNPYILITGDFNRRTPTGMIVEFPDIEHIDTEATRLGAALDIICTNLQDTCIRIMDPLETQSGKKSDHLVLYTECNVAKVDNFTKRTHSFYRKTIEGEQGFTKDLLAIDWDRVLPRGFSPTQMVENFNYIMDQLKDRHFELVRRTTKSTDAPWITQRIKDMIEKRKRIFKRHKKNDAWKKQKQAIQKAICESKKNYLNKTIEKLTEKGGNKTPYVAIKNLRSYDRPRMWDVRDIDPGKTDSELAEDMGTFFSSISDEFRPLDPSDLPDSYEKPMAPLQEYEVSAKIKHMKKPKSMTRGDLFPSLVERASDLLAIPLTRIYNNIIKTKIWPAQWQEEIVTVIPKSRNASTYGECRNLSCTPLFSKAMESFMMEKINGEVGKDPLQYGGLKGSGTEHMLVQAWNNITRSLEEENTSVSLISIDFAKAFNRMGHQACLSAYKKKGASLDSLGLIYAFLSGRTMRIKVGSVLSSPRPIKGGSPQGSVSANALFCATIQFLQEGEIEVPISGGNQRIGDSFGTIDVGNLQNSIVGEGWCCPFTENGRESLENSIPDPNPDPVGSPFLPGLNSTTLSQAQSPKQRVWRIKERMPFDTTDDTPSMPTHSMMVDALGSPKGQQEFWNLRYIDDGLGGETLGNSLGVTTFSTKKEQRLIHSSQCEDFLKLTLQNAKEIGMKINTEKTKLLCISPARHSDIECYINLEQGRILGSDRLKMLGFVFGNKPNADSHVEHICSKFYARLWTIRNLKSAGLECEGLVKLYTEYIRPTIEYASVVYGPILTKEGTLRIEKLQERALRTIYASSASYPRLLERSGIEKLATRRQKSIERFALKNRNNENWFLRREEDDRLRSRETYNIERAKTNRHFYGHLNIMRRFLNSLS